MDGSGCRLGHDGEERDLSTTCHIIGLTSVRGYCERWQGPRLPWFPSQLSCLSGPHIGVLQCLPPSQTFPVFSTSSHEGSLMCPLSLWKVSKVKPCSAKSPVHRFPRHLVHTHNINHNANSHSDTSSELYGSALVSLKAPRWPQHLLF